MLEAAGRQLRATGDDGGNPFEPAEGPDRQPPSQAQRSVVPARIAGHGMPPGGRPGLAIAILDQVVGNRRVDVPHGSGPPSAAGRPVDPVVAQGIPALGASGECHEDEDRKQEGGGEEGVHSGLSVDRSCNRYNPSVQLHTIPACL